MCKQLATIIVNSDLFPLPVEPFALLKYLFKLSQYPRLHQPLVSNPYHSTHSNQETFQSGCWSFKGK